MFTDIKSTLQTGYSWGVAALIFTLPSNLFFKLNESQAYVHGRLVDYLIPKIYLFHLISIAIICVGFAMKRLTKTRKQSSLLLSGSKLSWVIVASIIILLIRQIWTLHPLISVWWVGIFLLTASVVNSIWQNQKIWKNTLTVSSIWMTIMFQSSVALFQFFFQKSIAGYLLLGEPNLATPVGLATGLFSSQEVYFLPYGTTAHPNILAGTLVLLLIWMYQLKDVMKQKQWRMMFASCLIVALPSILLTQSIAAWIALVIAALIWVGQQAHRVPFKKNERILTKILQLFTLGSLILTPLAIQSAAQIYPESLSLVRRAYLNQAAWKMIKEHPFVGVGVGQFTQWVEQYASVREVVRFVQPVHHVLLLWLAETGIIGLIILCLIHIRYRASQLFLPILILLPFLTFDHWLLTQPAGLLLMSCTCMFFNLRHST